MMTNERPDRYTLRSGTGGSGQQFEAALTTLLALRLSFDSKVKRFQVSINNQFWGDFDDSVFEIEHEDLQRVVLAIQLKHTGKNVSVKNLSRPRGSYSLEKHFKTYRKIWEKQGEEFLKGVYFVLYTTGGYSGEICEFVWNRDRIKKVDCGDHVLDNFFKVPRKVSGKFQFVLGKKSSLVGKFLSQFFVYTNQSDYPSTISEISNLIDSQYSYVDEISRELLDFVTRWSKGDFRETFKLTKTEIILKLSELLLSPYISTPSLGDVAISQTDLWDRAVRSVDVTVVANCPKLRRKIWKLILQQLDYADCCDERAWLRPSIRIDHVRNLPKNWIWEKKEGNEISLRSLYVVCWKAGLVPLFLEVDSSNHRDIAKILEFCLTAWKRNFVLAVGDDVEVSGNFSKFERLSDLPDQAVLSRVQISIQDRFAVTLADLQDMDPDFAARITPELFLEALEEEQVGRAYVSENSYIERKIYEFHVEVTTLKYIRKDVVFVFCELYYHYDIFASLFPSRSIDFSPFRHVRKISEKNIFLVPYGISVEEVREFSQALAEKYHIFMMTEKASKIFTLKWVESTAPIDFIKRFKSFEGNPIAEGDVFGHTNNLVNVISDVPGMGKSTLMTRLCTLCPERFWALKIDLINHFNYKGEECALDYFYREIGEGGGLAKACFDSFAKTKRVVLFLDGFDEISPKHSDRVLEIVKNFRSRGLQQWITTRPATATILEKELGVLPSSIRPFDSEDQERFIEGYVQTLSSSKRLAMTEAFKASFRNLDITSMTTNEYFFSTMRRMTTDGYSFSAIPLHMKMLGEGLENHLVRNSADLSYIDILQLYENFVDAKFTLCEEKFLQGDKLANYTKFKEILRKNYMRLYQLSSMVAVFGKDAAQDFASKEVADFFAEVARGEEKNGIIVAIGDDNVPIFSHRIFAEFFAASWLAENWNSKRARRLALLAFHEAHAMVRLFFDKILAKKVAILRMVLGQDFQGIRNVRTSQLRERDEAGRGALHLACSWKNQGSTEIIDLLLERGMRPHQDKIFRITPAEYADQTGNIAAIEMMLRVQRIHFPRLKLCANIKSFAYGCIADGCVKTLKALAEFVNRTDTWTVTSDDDDLLFTAVELGDTEILKALLSIKGFRRHIKDTENHGYAALQLALLHKNESIAETLLDVDGWSAEWDLYRPSSFDIAMEESSGDIKKVLEESTA